MSDQRMASNRHKPGCNRPSDAYPHCLQMCLSLHLLADAAGDGGDFPEFGPLHSFTPLVAHQFGRCHPFGTASSSNGGYVDRSSLRNSQDISMLLRSGMLVEAALLSSNASRMHVIHDAGGCEEWLMKCENGGFEPASRLMLC